MTTKAVSKTYAVIYVAMGDDDHMCGHQHKSLAHAYRCGGGQLRVAAVTRSKADKDGNRTVTVKIIVPKEKTA